MSLRSRRGRARRERLGRLMLRGAMGLAVLAGIAAIGVQAHRTGARLAAADTERLEAELAAMQAARGALQDTADRLARERDDARAAQAALQRRYDAEVPTGALSDLLAAVRARLAGGLDAGRLTEAIGLAGPLVRCDGPPLTRRFRITAGERLVTDDAAVLVEGLVRVQVNAPAGFENLARTAVVSFTGLGIDGVERSTGLPVTKMFRIGNYELPVTVGPSGIAGFAAAAVPSCRTE